MKSSSEHPYASDAADARHPQWMDDARNGSDPSSRFQEKWIQFNPVHGTDIADANDVTDVRDSKDVLEARNTRVPIPVRGMPRMFDTHRIRVGRVKIKTASAETADARDARNAGVPGNVIVMKRRC